MITILVKPVTYPLPELIAEEIASKFVYKDFVRFYRYTNAFLRKYYLEINKIKERCLCMNDLGDKELQRAVW